MLLSSFYCVGDVRVGDGKGVPSGRGFSSDQTRFLVEEIEQVVRSEELLSMKCSGHCCRLLEVPKDIISRRFESFELCDN